MKNTGYSSTALLVGLLICLPPTARAAERLSLESLTSSALERSPVVRDRQKAVESARGALVSAKVLLPSNPEVTYDNVGDRYYADQGEGAQSLALEQEIEPWGQRGRRIAQAQAFYESAQRDLEAARLEVTLGVKRGYLRLLMLADRLQLLEELKTLAGRVQEAAGAKRASGLVSDVAYQIVAFESLGLENDYRNVRTVQDADLAELRRLAGMPEIKAEQIAGMPGFAPLNVDEPALVQQALDRRPDLLALRKEIESRRAGVSLLKRERLPEVRLRVGYSQERSVFEAGDFRYLPGLSPSVGRLADTDRLFAFGTSISLPVFRRNQGELITALSEADRAAIALEAAESQVATDVRRHLDRISGRGAILSKMQPALPELAAGLEDVTRAYTLGEYAIDRYLVEKDRLVRARLSYDDVLLDYLEAIVDLEQTVGGRLYDPEISAAEGNP